MSVRAPFDIGRNEAEINQGGMNNHADNSTGKKALIILNTILPINLGVFMKFEHWYIIK